MTNEEAVSIVEWLADSIVDASDAVLAVAEDAFRQATGLPVTDDIDEALGDLFCIYGDIWRQIGITAYCAGYIAARNGRSAA